MRTSKAKLLRYDAREGKRVKLKDNKNMLVIYKELKAIYFKGKKLPKDFKVNYLEFKK